MQWCQFESTAKWCSCSILGHCTPCCSIAQAAVACLVSDLLCSVLEPCWHRDAYMLIPQATDTDAANRTSYSVHVIRHCCRYHRDSYATAMQACGNMNMLCHVRPGGLTDGLLGQLINPSFLAVRPDIGHAFATLMLVPQLSVQGRTHLVNAIFLLQQHSQTCAFPPSLNVRAQLLSNNIIPVCFSCFSYTG
jgi:hypothetical protein